MGAIREGKWRCKNCSNENRGSHESCGGCGWTRDSTVQFYLDGDAPVVTDEKQIAKAKAGPNWVCDACDNMNESGRSSCNTCGSPKGAKRAKSGDVVQPIAAVGGAERASTPVREPSAAKAAVSRPATVAPVTPAAVATVTPPRAAAPPISFAQPTPSSTKAGGIACLAAFLAMIAVVFGVMGWVFKKHEDRAVVTAVSWNRTISVEALLPVHESEWESAPAGAREVSHKSEIHHTQQVQVGTHTEYTSERYQSGTETYTTTERVKVGTKTVVTGHRNLGNGHFEDITKTVGVYGDRPVTKTRPTYSTRKVPHEEPTYADQPVYREKYFYVVDRWSHARVEKASGNDNNPLWPKLTLAPNERECGRSEQYEATFSLVHETGMTKTLSSTDADLLVRYKLRSEWRVVWARVGDITVLGPADMQLEAGK